MVKIIFFILAVHLIFAEPLEESVDFSLLGDILSRIIEAKDEFETSLNENKLKLESFEDDLLSSIKNWTYSFKIIINLQNDMAHPTDRPLYDNCQSILHEKIESFSNQTFAKYKYMKKYLLDIQNNSTKAITILNDYKKTIFDTIYSCTQSTHPKCYSTDEYEKVVGVIKKNLDVLAKSFDESYEQSLKVFKRKKNDVNELVWKPAYKCFEDILKSVDKL